MLQTLKKWADTFRTKTVTSVESLFGGIGIAQFSDAESYLTKGTKVWASFKACDITANAVVSTPFSMTRKGSTVALDLAKAIPDLDRLLKYPNEDHTWGDLVYLTSNYLKWVGNAYWLKQEANLNGDRPRELQSLNPVRTRVIPSSTGEIDGYRYFTSRGPIEFPKEQVLHFKRPHPLNDYYGIGDLEAGESLIADAYNRDQYQNAFWKNGAAPSGMIVIEESSTLTDPATFEKAQREWNAKFKGRENAGKIAWFGGKCRYEKIGLTSVEMQDIERLKLTPNQIFLLHGVPLSVAGVESAANFATSDVDRQNFRENTVAPIVKIIFDTIQTDLIAGWDERLIITPNISGLINRGKVILDLSPAFDRGIFTRNEFRKELGLPPLEDPTADQCYMTSALVPADLAGVANMDQVEDEAKKLVKDFVQKALCPKNEPQTV